MEVFSLAHKVSFLERPITAESVEKTASKLDLTPFSLSRAANDDKTILDIIWIINELTLFRN